MVEMNETIQALHEQLDQLTALLAQEHDCLVDLRHDDLLRIVARKRTLQAVLADSVALLDSGDALHFDALRQRARQVLVMSHRNHQLATASMQVVEELRGVVLGDRPAGATYDRRGCSTRPASRPTLFDSA